MDRRQWQAAWAEARTLLSRQPDNAALHFVAGLVLAELGRLKEARQHLRTAVGGIDDEPELFAELGRVELLLGDAEAAEHALERAAELESNTTSLVTLGVQLERQGLRSQAIDALERAFDLDPGNAEVAHRIATLYQNSGSYPRAVDWAAKAVGLKQELFWEAGFTLASALHMAQRFEEALEAYHSLLLVEPDNVRIYDNLARLCMRLGLRERAVKYLGRATELEPNRVDLECDLIHQQMYANDWQNLAGRVAGVLKLLRTTEQAVTPFALFSLPGATGEDLKRATQRKATQMLDAVRFNTKFFARSISADEADRPLRVGYLSSDFHEHATAYLMVRLFELHDRSQFHIYAYHWDTEAPDPMRRRLERAFHACREIWGMADQQVAQLIHADEIDLLVDLKGYTRDGRLGILAYRPAPVQIHHVGFPGTLGAPFVDYFVADRFVAPPEHASHFVEKLAYMPDCYQPTDGTRPIGPRPSRRACGLPETGTVFCSLNQTYKITPDVFERWCQLLREVPGSVLWLLGSANASKVNLLSEAEQRGVERNRIVFAAPIRQSDHLGRLQNADVFLDTLPVNGHTTASDALWAGVPVVTLPGEAFVSRVAGSIVATLGLRELIARDAQDYVRIAKELGTNADYLSSVKARVQAARAASALFDTHRYTRNLEKLYRAMWHRRVRNLPPASLTVDGEVV